MSIAIALLCALLVMLALYEMTPVSSSVRARQLARVRGETLDDGRTLPRAAWRTLLLPLNPLINVILPQGHRDSVRKQLYWANFSGSWLGWNEVEFWGLSLALGAVGLVVFLPQNALIAAMSAVLGFSAPSLFLRNTARKVERSLTRELPDALYLLAAMVSVGIVTPEALRRLADYRGVFANWLRLALAKSHGGDLVAVIRAEAEASGQPRLIALATKLELITTKGAAGSALLLHALADDQSRDYRVEAGRRAKEIGSQLTFPILAFFFWPYMIVIAAPLFANIMRLFT